MGRCYTQQDISFKGESMEMLALLLLFPLLWPFVAKLIWNHHITFGELAINVAIGILIVVLGYLGGKSFQTMDQEVLNGQVTSKSRDKVSCSHSYRCMCVETCSTDSKGNRSCTEICQTCYDHAYDIDWNLATTLGTIEIGRVDRQGLDQPSRWTRAAAGDPVATTQRFTNYIQAAPASLFNAAVEKRALERYRNQVPAYPLGVFDYHYLNRVLAVGVKLPDHAEWNRELALRLRQLGAAKQVNWVVVLTSSADPAYADALRAAWLGGKKNDVIVVLGTPAYPNIGWARVLSWTDKELFKVQLRDDLQALKTADRTRVFDTIEKHVRASFVRKQMKDFEYLRHEIEPPGWLLALLFFLSAGASVGLSLYFRSNETY
jgi:hypothetical protein